VTPFSYLQILQMAAPETILVIAALAILLIDLCVLRSEELEHRLILTGAFACFGCVAAFFWVYNSSAQVNLLNGMLVLDPMVRLVKLAVLALAAFTILLSMDARFTDHVGEYLALVLLATVGMLFMVSAEELLTIFIALELTSL
jgi:NADH-quinone oxidoreductase subunit N